MTVDSLIEPLIKSLHNNGRLRVWSLVVTILGDAVTPRGGRISMADLLQITGHMGIEDGALRTALSRLSRDGWVVSTRHGRNSSYGFGPTGIHSSALASARIYAKPAPGNSAELWRAAILPHLKTVPRKQLQDRLRNKGALISNSHLALWPLDTAPDVARLEKLDCLVLDGTAHRFPAWLQAELAPPEVGDAYARFITTYAALRAHNLTKLSPLDAMVLRILMIHDWRRLVLRHPFVPQNLQPENWPANRALALVSALYPPLIDESEQFWATTSDDSPQILAKRFTS